MKIALGVGAIVLVVLVAIVGLGLLTDDNDSGLSDAFNEQADDPDAFDPGQTLTTEPVGTTPATTAPPSTAPPPTAQALPTVGPADYAGFRAQETACGAPAPPPAQPMSFAAPDDMGIPPEATVTAVLSTSCGDITIELDPSAAPATVNSFAFLADAGYFDGTASHRIVEGFMMQAGDPTATGRGGPGYTIPDELPDAGELYRRGIVAMANAGPNTSGSQFFIMHGDSALPPSFSIFGEVIDGFEVLDTIAALPVAAKAPGAEISTPVVTLYIDGIDIVVE